jgi:predicted Rdx family selenoprotein
MARRSGLAKKSGGSRYMAELKQRLRDRIAPDRDLGHSDKHDD